MLPPSALPVFILLATTSCNRAAETLRVRRAQRPVLDPVLRQAQPTRGFTLIELLVVMAIIAILATILNGGINVTFFDGHAKWVNSRVMAYDDGTSSKNPRGGA